MLAFDIETTGLKPGDSITAACVFDPTRNIKKTFIFALGASPIEFINELDEAEQLCAFNGARFDIPFIQREWNVPAEKIQQWRLKLFDIYEICTQTFKKGFSLNQLLLQNAIDVKTGTGHDAVTLARQGQWMELGEYCMQDTIKTYMVSILSKIKLPLQFAGQIYLVLDKHNNLHFTTS